MPGSEIKSGARKLMAENAPKLFVVSIIFIIIVTVISELQYRLPATPEAYQLLLQRLSAGEMPGLDLFLTNFRTGGVALAAVLMLFDSVVQVGFVSYCLKINRKQDADYKNILDGFAFFLKIILIYLITTLLTFLWALLFFFPGFVAYYRYRLAYYILLDDPEKGALQCIRESKQMMHGNKLDLFLLDLSFIGWQFVNLMLVMLLPTPFMLPLVSIWLTPYIGLSRAAFYDHILEKLAV